MNEKNWPERIFLQSTDDDENKYDGDTTWCPDRVTDLDIEYVRIDLVKELKKENKVTQAAERAFKAFHNYNRLFMLNNNDTEYQLARDEMIEANRIFNNVTKDKENENI